VVAGVVFCCLGLGLGGCGVCWLSLDVVVVLGLVSWWVLVGVGLFGVGWGCACWGVVGFLKIIGRCLFWEFPWSNQDQQIALFG